MTPEGIVWLVRAIMRNLTSIGESAQRLAHGYHLLLPIGS
jgi:hypothetical protein